MSYCELKIVREDGEVQGYKEFRNAWGFAPKIWTCIFDKYVKDHEVRFDNWMGGQERLWAAYNDLKIPHWIRVILYSTFDHMVIERTRIKEYADLLDLFAKEFPTEGVCHLSTWAEACREIEASPDPSLGVCGYHTSVSQDLWLVTTNHGEDGEDSRPYNVLTDDDHSWVFGVMDKLK